MLKHRNQVSERDSRKLNILSEMDLSIIKRLKNSNFHGVEVMERQIT